MTKLITSLFSAKNLALALSFCLPMLSTAQVIFTQNFNASTTLTDYHNVAPTEHQFDFIGIAGTTSANAGSSVNNASSLNKLRAYRFAGVYAFARTTDFVQNATPSVLKIKFKINVISHTATTTSPGGGSFSVGSGFAASATAEDTLVTVHSRLAFGFVGNLSPSFFLRTGVTNSATYNTEQDVSWYINNSGASINYINPNGVGSTSLANDKADIWVGTTRIFSDISASVPAQNLTDFKFTFNNSGGTITVDDIEISTGSAVLPVTLSNFTAQKTGAANQLTWTTETEVNNKGYNVERLVANDTWASLGFVNGTGKASTYTFEDKNPLSISYYRLRQVDFDGKETLSKVISVSQDTKGRIGISPNPTSDKVTIEWGKNGVSDSEATLTLFDMTGRQVLSQKTSAETCQLDLSNLAKGVYMLTVQSNNAIYQERIIRQ